MDEIFWNCGGWLLSYCNWSFLKFYQLPIPMKILPCEQLPQVGTMNFEVQVCLPHTRKVTVSEAEGDLLSNRSTVFNQVVLKSETFVVEAETRGGILQWLTMQVLMLEFLLDHRWWCWNTWNTVTASLLELLIVLVWISLMYFLKSEHGFSSILVLSLENDPESPSSIGKIWTHRHIIKVFQGQLPSILLPFHAMKMSD